MKEAPRTCQMIGAKGNGCIKRAREGFDTCEIHSGDAEIKRAHLSAMGKKGAASRWAAKDDDAAEDLKALLAACEFDTLDSIEAYLRVMARYALAQNDPRFLTGAARIVETSRWYLEAKKWQAECLEWRKRYKVKPSPIEGEG